MRELEPALIRRLLILGLAASCAAPPAPPPRVEIPPEPKSAPVLSEPPAFQITLSGDPLIAPRFEEESLGVIPLGRWSNAVSLTEAKHGFEFAVSLENCSGYGCTIQTPEGNRVLVAKKGIARVVRLNLYDEGWRQTGNSAVNDDGWVAVPMSGPGNKREVWIIKENNHMHKRLAYGIRSAVITYWGRDCVYLLHGAGTDFKALRISISTGASTEVPPIEPFWAACESETAQAVGFTGEVPDMLAGLTGLPVWRRGEPKPGLLELTPSVRPMTPEGLASPVRVDMDCMGRVSVISALSSAIWCMRFGTDGKLLNASPISGALTGDYNSIRTDRLGRFYFLLTEMDEDGRTPRQLHLRRLN